MDLIYILDAADSTLCEGILVPNALFNVVSTIITGIKIVVPILLIIWGLGFLSVIIWQIYCYQKFTKIVNQNLSPLLKDGAIMQKLVYFKQRLGINGIVDIAYSPIIRSPILIGLIKPKIIFQEKI